jgi:hypothetical protein
MKFLIHKKINIKNIKYKLFIYFFHKQRGKDTLGILSRA